VTEVGPIRSAVVIVGGSEDDDVVTTAERILVERDRTKINVRVMAGSLVGGRAIEVPVGELAEFGNLLSDRLDGDNEFQTSGSSRWTPRDAPCSYNEVRCGHQSKRLREKVSREMRRRPKILTFSLDTVSLVGTLERGKKFGAVARHDNRYNKCGE